jgi:hypothetical protein
MVRHACNLSTQESEAEGLQVQGQLQLHSETLSQKTINNNHHDSYILIFL